MLKKLATLAFLLVAFSIPKLVLATSGACSYHGGVNCSAGADFDGSVICMDGWRDSTVLYSSMSECSQQQSCMVPTGYWDAFLQMKSDQGVASLETQKAALEIQKSDLISQESQLIAAEQSKPIDLSLMNGRVSTIRNEWGKSIAVIQTQIDSLSSQISAKTNSICMTLNQRALDDAAKAVPNPLPSPIITSSNQPSCSSYGQYAYLTVSNTCRCKDGYHWNDGQTQCVAVICSQNSHIDGNSCTCNEGYLFGSVSKSCVDYNASCHEQFGANSYAVDAQYCRCLSGFQFNEQKQCVAFQATNVKKTIFPAPTVPVIKYASTAKRVYVRSLASSKSRSLGVTVAKRQYKVLEEKPLWVKVQFGKKIGWILKILTVIK